MTGRHETIKHYALLHLSFLIYSFVALASKMTSGKEFFSSEFFGFAALVFILLVLYAFLWQKVLKVFPLVTAYSNKGAVIIWNLIWASLIMGEKITASNMVGSAIIIFGIVVVSSDER
jgi:drug/metabolite transporter (DMT)-like permease